MLRACEEMAPFTHVLPPSVVYWISYELALATGERRSNTCVVPLFAAFRIVGASSGPEGEGAGTFWKPDESSIERLSSATDWTYAAVLRSATRSACCASSRRAVRLGAPPSRPLVWA